MAVRVPRNAAPGYAALPTPAVVPMSDPMDWPESSIKPRHSRSSSYGGEDSPVAGGFVNFPKSAPSSPTVRFKSPGTALVALSRQLLDEQSREFDAVPLARQLPFEEPAAARSQLPTRVVRRPAAVASAPSGPSRAPAARPAAAPAIPFTRPKTTVPIGTTGSLPRFMQQTASARSRVAPGPTAVAAPAAKPASKPYSRPAPMTAPAAPRPVSRPAPAPATVVRRVQPAPAPAPQIRRNRPAPAAENRPPARQQQKPQQQQGNRGMTIPETPQWARNNRGRQRGPKAMSTEERELTEVAQKKRELAERNARNRQRLQSMQGAATHEQRMTRTASAFTPHKAAPVQRTARPQQPELTRPQPFQLSQPRR